MITLVHEAVHLERGEAFHTREVPWEERWDEEARAWAETTIKVARPLRTIGEPVEIDLIEADDILRRCGDDRNCPEFREFVKTKIN